MNLTKVMRTTVISLALAAVSLGFAQISSVVEQVSKVGNKPVPLLNFVPSGTGAYGGLTLPEFASANFRYAYTDGFNWSGKDMVDISAAAPTPGRNGEGGFWSKNVTAFSNFIVWSVAVPTSVEKFRFNLGGEFDDVVTDRGLAHSIAACVVKSAPAQLVTFHDYGNYAQPVFQALPNAVRAVDAKVLASGVSFVTTVRADGRVDYHNLFSKGGIRWSLSFPAGTILKADPSGHTYAATPTANGILVRRFDFNANPEGEVLLPTSYGDKLLDADSDPNHYFFLLTSRPNNGRRNAQVLRLNPALQVRSMSLEGDLATGKPGQMACDSDGEAYALTTSTARAVNSARLSTLDSRSFQLRWNDVRPLATGQEAGKLECSSGGAQVWANRPNATGTEGFIVDYRENGFRSINVVDGAEGGIRNGGGVGFFRVEAYGKSDVDRSFKLTSSNPDLVLPDRLVLPAGSSQVSTPISIPQGAVRRLMPVTAQDEGTKQIRTLNLVVEPWVAPTLYILLFRPNTVVGGTQAKLQFHFTGQTKGWVTAQLTSSSDGGVIVPGEVTLPHGNVCDVMLDTLPVTAKVVRQVTARVGTVTKFDYLTINP